MSGKLKRTRTIGNLNESNTKEKITEQNETDSIYRTKCDELSATSKEAGEKRKRERREAGRYTLEEAARFIADSSNASADSILLKLRKAAIWPYDILKIYKPGSDEVYKPERVGFIRSNPVDAVKGWEEAYAKDLNQWLEKYETIIFDGGCKFPEPTAKPKAGSANSNTNEEPPGITPGMVTITKLAITAAWEIEGDVGRIR